MIDTSSIVLDPEYIFADVTTCAAALICLPIANAEGTEPDLGAFFKSVVVNAQTDPTEDSDHVAKILNFLNSSSVFSLPGFKKLLDDLRNEPSAPTVTVEVKKIPNGQPSVGAPAVPSCTKDCSRPCTARTADHHTGRTARCTSAAAAADAGVPEGGNVAAAPADPLQ